jgi:hypothetical protein
MATLVYWLSQLSEGWRCPARLFVNRVRLIWRLSLAAFVFWTSPNLPFLLFRLFLFLLIPRMMFHIFLYFDLWFADFVRENDYWYSDHPRGQLVKRNRCMRSKRTSKLLSTKLPASWWEMKNEITYANVGLPTTKNSRSIMRHGTERYSYVTNSTQIAT